LVIVTAKKKRDKKVRGSTALGGNMCEINIPETRTPKPKIRKVRGKNRASEKDVRRVNMWPAVFPSAWDFSGWWGIQDSPVI
jgi:hypothetical protein